ncbi:MAG: hypothetical protein KDH20_06550 [Rhodocyclaceae bacterium]|nr:hypothetical protein [Rhodocyclaceae bacterium]
MKQASATRRRLTLGLLASGLVGCGFRLRGARPLPFATLHVAGPVRTELLREIRRRVEASGDTRVVGQRSEAEATLEVVSAGREKNIIGLSGSGKVREYEFRQGLRFRLMGRDGSELIPETALATTREATWDDSAILAKEQEEALLFTDMEQELVRQMMRRLEAATPGA